MKYGEGSMGAATMPKSKIGVLDVENTAQLAARTIKKELPEYEIIYTVGDMPLRSKITSQIQKILVTKIQDLINQDCRVIIIISHNLSSEEVNRLRSQIKIPIIDMAPTGTGTLNHKTGKIPLESVIQAARQASTIQRSKE